VLAFVLVMVAAAAVVLVLSSPFRERADREAGDGGGDGGGPTAEVGDLEAAKEAKYREIRDAELDHRTGKLSDEDFQAIDGTLRAEAISILQELDRAREPR
jgi:hypothetical protein